VVSTVVVGRHGRHLVPGSGEFALRVMGADTKPSLGLRLPGPNDPAELVDGEITTLDPLYGNEIWRAVTATTMLVGLRSTVSSGQLLEMLDCGRLTGLRFRMATARPTIGRRDWPRAQDRTFGTLCGLSTLLCWPGHARAELTARAAEAAKVALQRRRVTGHREAALVMRWVLALAEAFPGDPLVLAPLLLKLRWFEAGQEFMVPARWPLAMLAGEAVGVSGEGSVVMGAGLGAGDADPVGFVSGLESRAGELSVEPHDEVLARALVAARRHVCRPSGRPA
jgi:hypothetical protein